MPGKAKMQLLPPHCLLSGSGQPSFLQCGLAWAAGAFRCLKASRGHSAVAILPSAGASSEWLVLTQYLVLLIKQSLM